MNSLEGTWCVWNFGNLSANDTVSYPRWIVLKEHGVFWNFGNWSANDTVSYPRWIVLKKHGVFGTLGIDQPMTQCHISDEWIRTSPLWKPRNWHNSNCLFM
jgi:hypothetical protein